MTSFLSLVTGPASEPVDVVTLKTHIRVDGDDEDALLFSHLEAARRWAEGYTRRALLEQTWDLIVSELPTSGRLELPLPPLKSITHVKFYDAAGTLQTWASTDYSVLAPAGPAAERGAVVLKAGKSWPSYQTRPDAVQVRFVAGYGTTAAAVPAGIRSAILLYAGELFKHREQSMAGTIISKVPLSAEALLDSFRSLRAA